MLFGGIIQHWLEYALNNHKIIKIIMLDDYWLILGLLIRICLPIASMYAIYGNIYHQYTPNVSIYTSTMDPSWVMLMGWFPETSPWKMCLCRICRRIGGLLDSDRWSDPGQDEKISEPSGKLTVRPWQSSGLQELEDEFPLNIFFFFMVYVNLPEGNGILIYRKIGYE